MSIHVFRFGSLVYYIWIQTHTYTSIHPSIHISPLKCVSLFKITYTYIAKFYWYDSVCRIVHLFMRIVMKPSLKESSFTCWPFQNKLLVLVSNTTLTYLAPGIHCSMAGISAIKINLILFFIVIYILKSVIFLNFFFVSFH